MTQTTEKWDSLVLSTADFWMVWRYHGIPFFHFYFFLFRSNNKKNNWVRNFFVIMIVIISKVSFWKLLDISCFQSSNLLWGILTTTFENIFEDFNDGILSWINIMKKNGWRCLGNYYFLEEHRTKTFQLLLNSFFSLKNT